MVEGPPEIWNGRSSFNSSGMNLHSFVKKSLPDKLLEIVDSTMLPLQLKQTTVSAEAESNSDQSLSHMDPNELKKCLTELFYIGLACTGESPKERINMRVVTRELDLIRIAFSRSQINEDLLISAADD